ncbi:hypothetical protein GGR53DRAFT_512554 [Hypoxylon sp. FL1150]|nr:hypothetical protein GGR53DRAFT_512554 [Hypoxylon sp. FL1150]
MYMDEFLLSDEEEPAPGTPGQGQAPGKGLRRGDRWIPEIEHRRRATRKPAGVPHGLWMSYRFLDDYMYRMALTEEEVLAHPLLDDMYCFQSGGPQPVTPPGFRWDEKELVPFKAV